MSHPQLTKLTSAQVGQQMTQTDELITAATGVVPATMRPPYGARNARVDGLMSQAVILWDVDPLDWKIRNASKVAAAVGRDTQRNSIVLLPDIHPTSVDTVPEIIRALKADGYTFVTVSTVLTHKNMIPWQVYRHGR